MSEFDEKTRVTAVVPAPSVRRRGSDCLVVIYTKDQSLLGKRFVLEQSPFRVGRGSDNHVVLEGDSVSRRHAHWERRGEAWWIVDDGSTNGTYVNDELIARQQSLQNGDRIKIGGIIFKYLSGEDVESQYHEEIYKMTIIDGLVQIYNKRFLYEALEREITRARRHARDLAVVMFDIDFFKRINDQFGHLAGDYVLKELAKVVQARIRRDEIFARYGGEEFSLVLPETSLQGAYTLCEAIRERVAQYRFAFQGEHIPVTISMGVTILQDTDRVAPDVIARADEKLYEAKRTGRNKVCALPPRCPQLRPHPHQRLPQHVLAAPVAPVAPVAIPRGVLDQLFLAGPQQQRLQLLVLLELGPHHLVHHLVLHRLPVPPQRPAPVSPHPRRLPGALRPPDCLLVEGALELLRLEVVLRRGPALPLQHHRVRREIREPAVSCPGAVEPYRHAPHSREPLPILTAPDHATPSPQPRAWRLP